MNLQSKVISFDKVYIFDMINQTWICKSTKGDIPEARSGMQRTKGQLDIEDHDYPRYVIFFGGYSAKNVILKDLYSFDLEELRW